MLAEFINKASSIKRRNPNPGHYVKSWLEQAGLEDVHQEVVTYEVGVSEKDPEYAAKSEVAIMSMVSKYESLASSEFVLHRCLEKSLAKVQQRSLAISTPRMTLLS